MSGIRTECARALIVDDEPGPTEPLSGAVTGAGRGARPVSVGEHAPCPAGGRVPHAVVLNGTPLHSARIEAPRLRRRSGVVDAKGADDSAPTFAVVGRAEGTREAHRDSKPVRPFPEEFALLGLPPILPRRMRDKKQAPSIHTERGIAHAVSLLEDGR